MRLIWSTISWDDYLYWQKTDKTLNRINELLKSCPFECIGKPEALKGDLKIYLSRRIDSEHRLVYKYEAEQLFIASCRYHYKSNYFLPKSAGISPQAFVSHFTIDVL